MEQKINPKYTINNYEEIKKIDPKLKEQALEARKNKIAANEDFNNKEEEFLD